jgi:uncharacterized protein
VSASVLTLVVITVVMASSVQRITGIGFALVASPLLLVTVGADEAVRLVGVTSVVSCTVALRATWALCRPRQVLPLLPFALLAAYPAALLATAVSPAVSSMVAGFVVLAALAVSVRPNGLAGVPAWGQAAVAGTLSGAMNAVAGLAGPMAAAYGLGRRWGPALIPNMQVFLLISSFVIVVVRGWPARTDSWQLAVLGAAAVGGVLVGGWLARGVAPHRASMLTATVALVGASIAIVRGAAALA